MAEVFLKLLNMSITAGWLVLAIVILRVFLKKAPKWVTCLLWVLVAVRLLCPISPESMFSLIPSAETVPAEILYAQEPTIHTGVSAINSMVNPVLSKELAPVPEYSVNPMQIVTAFAAYIWILGMAAMIIYGVGSYVRIHRKVRASVQIKDNMYLCDYIETPFILGMIKPKIYIPSTLEQENVVYVIAHEKAHIKRGDYLWKPLGFILLSVYWFHPLLWVAYVLFCRDIELACDEKVISDFGEKEKKSYSNALLACSIPRKMIAACPLAFGEVDVKERVRTVLHYRKPAFWVIVVSVFACVAVAVCFLTNPKEQEKKSGEILSGNYVSSECLYMNPFSSFYPFDGDSGDIYKFLENTFIIENKSSGAEQYITPESWEWQEFPYTDEEWQELFAIPGSANRLANIREQYEEIQYLKLSEKYCLLKADEDLLLLAIHDIYKMGRHVWCAYSLVPEGTKDIKAEQTVMDIIIPTQGEPLAERETTEEIMQETIAENFDPLEQAIHEAIMGKDMGKEVANVLFPCESHVILGTQEAIACGVVPEKDGNSEDAFGQTDTSMRYLTVYAMVLTQTYVFQEPHGKIVDDGGSHMPVAITFEVTKDGEYKLVEYWRPKDGSYYEPSIRDKFPDDIEDEAMDTQKYILAQIQNCYAQAVEFGSVDTDAVIEELFEKIESSPGTSSNPGDYMEFPSLIYREMTYYGDYTLEYIFKKFLEGGQTDLRGQLMRIVLDKMAPESVLRLHAETGQKYFDVWLEKAEEVYAEKGGDWMAENMPAAWLCLQMKEAGAYSK